MSYREILNFTLLVLCVFPVMICASWCLWRKLLLPKGSGQFALLRPAVHRVCLQCCEVGLLWSCFLWQPGSKLHFFSHCDLLLFCVYDMYMDACVPKCMRGGQRTALWSGLSFHLCRGSRRGTQVSQLERQVHFLLSHLTSDPGCV